MRKFYKTIPLGVVCLFLSFSASAQIKLSESKHGPAISSYLNTSAKTGKLSATDIQDLYISNETFSEKTGVTNLYLNQYYKGIKLVNVSTSIAVKNNKVFHMAGTLEANIAQRINIVIPSVSPTEAIAKVANHFKLGSVGNLNLISTDTNKSVYSKGAISKENIPVEQVFFKTREGNIKLAWDLSILTQDGKHWWSVRLDAKTGAILDINDWTLECTFGDNDHANHQHRASSRATTSPELFKPNSSIMTDGSQYNVYALPTESPNHGPRTLVTEPADPLASPFGWHDDNGIAGTEYTTTKGNNVLVYDDSNGTNSIAYSADGGASLNFDFPIDFDSQPVVSRDASLTNLFYVNNMVHDIMYYYGFDEESGNFQKTDYAGVNLAGAGDPVIADGLDGSDFNNANFSTPPDGNNPRMQMFLWNTSNGNTLTINNGSLAGSYVGIPAAFGDELPAIDPLTAELALTFDDNSGTSTDINDACDPIIDGASLNGKIAIINRGSCDFGTKILAVQNEGAVAAIVITDDRPVVIMGAGDDGDQVTIPSIMISRADGVAIIAALRFETISASLVLPPYIDGSYDNGVIIHEYGHGISIRLTGGAKEVNCLRTCTERDSDGKCVEGTYTEQMGEGWSDWFALMLTMKSTDNGATGRGIATYDAEQPINGPGIRPFRYSTDMSVNPLTYNDTNNTVQISAPHGVGSVWCTMLWDLTWSYIDKYGFDPDFYNGTGGNNKIMQIVLDALKLQPCEPGPGFVDGRDAILAADLALTGGQDQCMIWDVFARRGLGVNADQQDSLLRNDQIENFDTPDTSDPSLANCTTLSSEEFGTSDYKIYPNPANNLINIKPKMALGDVTMTLVDINGRTVLQNKTNFNDTVTLDISGLQTGLYILNINGDFINTNEKILIE
ncbi:T9SS-dependent M36 family metallopeptidase [Gaetbulibacter sp. M240]|uniref:T9SS-dependent M36 family metallopeptidase n=1 Tax=Gaetbulibacter sp. M240 TaxID=3126511 RepID=UPI00374F329B